MIGKQEWDSVLNGEDLVLDTEFTQNRGKYRWNRCKQSNRVLVEDVEMLFWLYLFSLCKMKYHQPRVRKGRKCCKHKGGEEA